MQHHGKWKPSLYVWRSAT